MKDDKIQESLLKFSDAIYAIVFVFIVRESFDAINKNETPISELAPSLLLIAAMFYFFVWDWILGRMLTLRNPYQSYTRFFLEVLIAAFAYGTASTAIKGNIIFLLYFCVVLLLGVWWAKRTERHIVHQRDSIELCAIRALQSVATFIIFGAYIGWESIDMPLGWVIAIPITLNLWCFILFYEICVPRFRGVLAGPGVPFLSRPNVRKARKWIRDNV